MMRPWTFLVTFTITVVGVGMTMALLDPLPLTLSVLVMMVWGAWLGWIADEKGGWER